MRFLKNTLFPAIAFIAIFSLAVTSCSKDDDPGPTPSASRKIKYELTGSYSGKLSVSYTNTDGVQQNAEVSSLPWSLEVTVKQMDFAFISLGAQTGVVGPYGSAGQTLTGKIYQGGVVKKEATVNVYGDGLIMLPVMGFNLFK